MTHIVRNDGSGWSVCLFRAVQAAQSGDTVIVPNVAMVAFAHRWMTLRKITGISVIADKEPYTRVSPP